MPAVQARQITDLLNDLKASGEVRDAEEYQFRLQELATLINDKAPKPSFQQIRALIWQLTSSDAHNTMMKAAKNDVEALFQQVDEIGGKVDDHHLLVMKNLAADLERALADQENTIRRLEWLADRSNEFSLALVNSFTSASLFRIARSEVGAENLYFDNRTYQTATEVELPGAVVSEHGQRLILGSTNEPRVLPVSVTMLTDQYSHGTQVQTSVNNDLANVIDGTRGTFWTREVYLGEPVAKVTTVLEFSLGIAQDINYMVVEGATQVPFYIETVKAVAPDGHKVDLLDEPTEVSGWTRLDFPRTLARTVQVTFSMNSYQREEHYTQSKETELHEVMMTSKDDVTRTEAAGPLAREVLASEHLGDILNVPEDVSTRVNSFVYAFSLDNVWFGNSLYEDSGIFVSKPLKGSDFGVVAVRSDEYTDSPEVVPNSIEYEIIKVDTSPKYKETKFPIPRLGQTSVVHERLVLTKKEPRNEYEQAILPDAGQLRFCPYVDPSWDFGDPAPITVYQNGVPLTLGGDDGWYFAIHLDSNNELDWETVFTGANTWSEYQLTPPKMWIKIGPDTLDPTSIYTVSYTIRTSDTYIDDNTVWLDKDKTTFLGEGGRVYFRRENPDVTIESKLYLQATLRRNAASQKITPELREYAILGALYA
jgi:hypothetical protein